MKNQTLETIKTIRASGFDAKSLSQASDVSLRAVYNFLKGGDVRAHETLVKLEDGYHRLVKAKGL